MRLAKLTVSGFKSFADKTEFTFDHRITGVVGPNGCGKSNIVDAIKWVLGERSSKSLRGTEMLDVIFAGSAGRKPGGMASVALTFENPVVVRQFDELGQPVAVAVPGGEDVQGEEGQSQHRRSTQTTAEQSEEGVGGVGGVGGVEGSESGEEVVGIQVVTATATATEESSVVDTSVRSRRLLPIDSDMVEVERRLYRDGESAYLINGKKARLKDIRELFLDTGVGADAYSIIEQGKVDAMLMASPQERRVIFEEAAGIAKYKQRRVEAQRKLDRAEVNLKTAREELDSTDRRLRLVRGQAAKARKFKELDSELGAWRLSLAFEQFDELEQRIIGLAVKHSELGTKREESAVSLAELEAQKQQAELLRQEASSKHKAVEQERLTAVHAEQQATQRRTMLERSITDAQKQTSMDRERLVAAELRRQETETAITQYREAASTMAEQLAAAEGRLASAGEQRAAVLEELNERRQAAQQKTASVMRIDRERVGLLASITSDAKRADAVKEQIDRLTEKAGRLAGDEKTVKDGISGAEQSVKAATGTVSELEQRLGGLEVKVGELGTDRRGRAQRVAQLDQEMVRADSRRATLQEMVESRAGFAEAVRAVLGMRDGGKGFAGVIAPLADLIETKPDADAEAAAAVETALGADLQALVVESAAKLPGRDELASIKGRVTFVAKAAMAGFGQSGGNGVPNMDDGAALSGLAGTGVGGNAMGQNGLAASGLDITSSQSRLVSLRSLVKPREGHVDDAGLHELLDRLLGRTYLVADVDAALMLAAGPFAGRPCRFVTRDGASVIDAQGRVVAGAGSADESIGILRRRAELEELQAKVAALGTQLKQERAELQAVDAEAGELSAEAGRVRNALAQAQRSTLQEQNKLERLMADAARLSRERNSLESETSQLTERLKKLEEDRAKLQERADSLGRLHAEETAAAQELDAAVRTITQRADASMEQATAAKVEVSRLSEQSMSTRRELSRLEMSRDELTRHTRDLDTQVQRLDARVAEHQHAVEEAVEQIAQAQANTIRLSAEATAAAAETTAADSSVGQLAGQLVEVRRAFGIIEREWHSLELAKRELEVKRENAQERCAEELNIDLQAEYPEYQQMMAGGDVARIDTSEAALRIDTLKDAVKKLGSVNLEAIDEESTLAQQNDDLIKQVADIDEACKQLSELILKLNDVSRSLFGEVFKRIQDNFGGEQGMFRKLFNGGKAEVRLMPLMKEVEDADGVVRKVETDEIDVLESGVEVIAKPPGKEPRSISQLSGGEKTLTAVALLMSIFRSKPSCFCVLDEVDAALDEGNVGRFNSVVREYTDRSSFIVITHNKRTMQSADRLYGVTMQERGVSTRVSVRFDQVGKNGEIKTTDHGAADGASENMNGHAKQVLNVNGHVHPEPVKSQSSELSQKRVDGPIGIEAPVVVVPSLARSVQEADMAPDGTTGSKGSRKKSGLKPVKADPHTLRQALAAMRELAESPEESQQQQN